MKLLSKEGANRRPEWWRFTPSRVELYFHPTLILMVVATMVHQFILGRSDSPMTNFLHDQQKQDENVQSADLLASATSDHDDAISFIKRKLERAVVRRQRNAAFESWRKKRSNGEQLPRGRYFEGKKPGAAPSILGEFGYYAFKP